MGTILPILRQVGNIPEITDSLNNSEITGDKRSFATLKINMGMQLRWHPLFRKDLISDHTSTGVEQVKKKLLGLP